MKTQIIWTDDEINILKTHGATHLKHQLLTLLPKHTTQGINKKRERLGIKVTTQCLSQIGKHARSLVNNDNLCKTNQELTFNDLDNTTKQIIIGTILGDGSIKKNTSGKKKYNVRNFLLYDGHKRPQFDYTDWKATKLQTFLAKSTRNEIKNYSEMWTTSHPIFTTLRDQFYAARTNSTKSKIPIELAQQMDELALLIWYLDDGTLGTSKTGYDPKCHHRRPSPKIAAKGWNYTDLHRTVETLNKNLKLHMNIKQNKYRDSTNKVIHIPAIDRNYLFPIWQELATHHNLPQCMAYKFNLHKHPKPDKRTT